MSRSRLVITALLLCAVACTPEASHHDAKSPAAPSTSSSDDKTNEGWRLTEAIDRLKVARESRAPSPWAAGMRR